MKAQSLNRRRAGFISIVLFASALLGAAVVHADPSSIVPPEFANSLDISKAVAALVSFSTTPGITSADFTIRWPDDQPNVSLTKSGFEFDKDFNLPTQYFKLFTGFGFSHINMSNSLKLQTEGGSTVAIDPEIDLLAARVSGGVTFQLTPRIRITPYASFVYSDVENKASVRSDGDFESLPPVLELWTTDWNFKSTTIAGTLEARYDRWFERKRIELFGRYTYTYTHTFDESSGFLDSSDQVSVIDLDGRWTAPTGLKAFGIPIRWKLIGGYTHLLDVSKSSLGFRYFFEYGGGLDLEVDVRPLNFFEIRNLGLTLAGIAGDDVTGFSFSLSFTQ